MRTARLALLMIAATFGSFQLGSSTAPAKGLVPIPDKVAVSLVAYGTPSAGATKEFGKAAPYLEVGGEGTAYVLTGSLDSRGRPVQALCLGSVGTADPRPAAVASSAYFWRARFAVLSATMESIVLDVDWSRESVDPSGVRSRTSGDRRTVTLNEGESQTLDYVASSDPSDPCAISLRVDVRATIAEDPRLAGKRIRYDLWLVDETSGGVREIRKFTATALHGEKIDFALDPVRWTLPGVTFTDGTGAEVTERVRGSIRGRLRDDGAIEAILGATRWLAVTSAGKVTDGGVGDGGEKSLRIMPGETLGLIIPPASGAHTVSRDQTRTSTVGAPGMTTASVPLPGPSSGVEANSERVTVDFAKFMRGHKVSLRLTAYAEDR